ncbi:MAG: hypothetical protein WCP12_17650, partial [bacterium]
NIYPISRSSKTVQIKTPYRNDSVGVCILDWQNEIFATMNLKYRRVTHVFNTLPLDHRRNETKVASIHIPSVFEYCSSHSLDRVKQLWPHAT